MYSKDELGQWQMSNRSHKSMTVVQIEISSLQHEVDSEQETLRSLDKSLHTLAFAYITVFSICIPALITSRNSVEQLFSATTVGVISFFLVTLSFVGGFYALMLVRSRNVRLGYIAFLHGRINEIVRTINGNEKWTVFLHSANMDEIYYGRHSGVVWMFAYILFFLIVMGVPSCISFILNLKAFLFYLLSILTAIEIALTIFAYIYYFKTSGGKRIRAQIESAYHSSH